MPLTDQDILRKTFKRSFIGYNEDEVDRFLDRVSEQVRALQAENKEPLVVGINAVVGEGDIMLSLTAQDILKKTFRRSYKGYDEDEVDRFLDRVIELVKAQQEKIDALEAKIDALNTVYANQ